MCGCCERGLFCGFLTHVVDLLCTDKGFPVRVFNFVFLFDWGFCSMSTMVELSKPYTSANLSFAAVGVRHVGDVEAWGSAVMNLDFVSWDSGEGAHVGYDVEATDPTKKAGDAGWYIGRVSMHAIVGGAIALDDELMRRLVDEVKTVLRNRVAQGQPIVEVKGWGLVFDTRVMIATD